VAGVVIVIAVAVFVTAAVDDAGSADFGLVQFLVLDEPPLERHHLAADAAGACLRRAVVRRVGLHERREGLLLRFAFARAQEGVVIKVEERVPQLALALAATLVAVVVMHADHGGPHDRAERVDDARETRDVVSFTIPLPVLVPAPVIKLHLRAMGALAVDVLEAVIREEGVRSFGGIVMVGRFVSEGDGEGHLGLEARQTVPQREDVFGIRLSASVNPSKSDI
jgi:hypothetical protein